MRTRFTMAVVAALITLAAVGCSGGGGRGGGTTALVVGPTRESLAAAADRTLDGSDFRMEFTMVFAAGNDAFTATGSCESDSDNDRLSMRMAMDLPGIGSQSVDAVFDGGVMYMKVPVLGDQWVRVDLDAVAPGVGDLLGAGAATQDPTQLVALLKGANDVQDLGREDVRGVSTGHFTGSYTIGDALDTMTGTQRRALDQVLHNLPDSVLDTEVPFDAWVDDEGRVRRLDMTMGMAGIDQNPGLGGTIDVRLEPFDFGRDVTVPVPADALDFSDLMSSFNS